MSDNSKASLLSIKIYLRIFSAYCCLFNCIYQMDNFSFCQENHGVYVKWKFIVNHLLLHTLSWSLVLSHCFSKTIASLELMFVPCFAHAIHIMLPENCWPINSLYWKLSAWIRVDVGYIKFHSITKLRELTSVLLGLLVHLSAHYVRITSIMNIKLIKTKQKTQPFTFEKYWCFSCGVSFGVQYILLLLGVLTKEFQIDLHWR